MNHKVAPSILAADFNQLSNAFELVNSSKADWFHVDVMDGRFVPNISFGFPVMNALKKVAKKPLDVHLMIVEPEKYLERFVKSGADILTVHYEACPNLHRTLQSIRELGAKAGLAINPHTPVELLETILGSIDLVCVMSVNPGFGGQKFIPETLQKISKLRSMKEIGAFNFEIEVDGGVDIDNYQALIEAGAGVLVAGSSVFGARDPENVIKKLKKY